MAQTHQRPPEQRSSPLSTWPLAGNILRRNRHKHQEGALAHASKPNARSSRAVVAACPLAVSEGRTLDGGWLAPSPQGWSSAA